MSIAPALKSVIRLQHARSLTTSRAFTTTIRSMASKQEWIVILPDNAGALHKRMEVRPQHIANLKPNVESGFCVMGGATLDEPIKEGQGPKINGSIIMAVAETKEEVLEKLKEDVYWKGNVWDQSKVSELRHNPTTPEPFIAGLNTIGREAVQHAIELTDRYFSPAE